MPFDAARLVALEHGAVLGEGDALGGILHRLPVRVVGATLHVVDLLAIQFERDAQFDDRFDDALTGQDALGGRLDLGQMAGADRGQGWALRAFDVNHAPGSKIALEGA